MQTSHFPDSLRTTTITSERTHATTSDMELDGVHAAVLKKCRSDNFSKDLAYFAISHSARRTLPYGMWTCEDGRQVLFNREYQPILDCKEDVYSYCDHNEWIGQEAAIRTTQYFYDDTTSPIRFLTRHLGVNYIFKGPLSKEEAKVCKKSLLICLKYLKRFTPKESGSVSSTFSISK